MNFSNVILYFILPVLSLSMLLIFIRLFKGPTLMDKVIALDLLVIVAIGSFAGYGILHDEVVIVDIALILAILAFLSTIAFTYYYEKGDYQINKQSSNNPLNNNDTKDADNCNKNKTEDSNANNE